MLSSWGITFCGSIWIAKGFILDRLFCFRVVDAQDWLIAVVFLYGGNIPFVVSLCFASQRTPTVCPNCAGSISTIGLAPFCFKSAGLALIWASAVLLWFLALLYTEDACLSIRRLYNKWDVLLHQKSKKLGYMGEKSGETKSVQNFRVDGGRFVEKSEKLTADSYVRQKFVLS